MFKAKTLNRLLRQGENSTSLQGLHLSGKFLRTDGVQAQIICGQKRVKKVEQPEKDPAYEVEDDEKKEDIVDIADSTPEKVCKQIQNLFACDPGKVNLFSVGQARLLRE